MNVRIKIYHKALYWIAIELFVNFLCFYFADENGCHHRFENYLREKLIKRQRQHHRLHRRHHRLPHQVIAHSWKRAPKKHSNWPQRWQPKKINRLRKRLRALAADSVTNRMQPISYSLSITTTSSSSNSKPTQIHCTRQQRKRLKLKMKKRLYYRRRWNRYRTRKQSSTMDQLWQHLQW